MALRTSRDTILLKLTRRTRVSPGEGPPAGSGFLQNLLAPRAQTGLRRQPAQDLLHVGEDQGADVLARLVLGAGAVGRAREIGGPARWLIAAFKGWSSASCAEEGLVCSRGASVITSTLASRAQTTNTRPVRAALRLKEGDEISYSTEGERVVLTKVSANVADDPFAAFDEWGTEADREAYADL